MGRVIMSGIVPLLTAPANYPENFADATWEQIIDACQKNNVPETWVVGSQKTMTINGASYPVGIIGRSHDTYAAGGKAPLTFQLHDCYATTYDMNSSNTNKGGWTSCAMRSTHLPAILALMPSEVQSGIREVDKLTSAGAYSSSIQTTKDNLFLLSEVEIFGTTQYSYAGEGTQYAYYKAGNSTTKRSVGVRTDWWSRSPNTSDSICFCSVNKSGYTGYGAASEDQGVSFAFCF